MRRSARALAAPVLMAALGLMLLPFLALLPHEKTREYTPYETVKVTQFEGEGFLVLDEATGEVVSMTDYQYVLGSVLSEMPASYGEEALKAQAVASHTYAMLLRDTERAGGKEPPSGADFAVNSDICKGYMDPADAEKYLGRDYEALLQKVESAVVEVIDEAIYYDNELISACYHAISPGMTEDSGNVFAVSVPYLAPVDSSWDKDAEGYQSEIVLDAYTMDSMLKLYDSAYESSGSPASWIGDMQKSESGTVLELEVCGRPWKGTDIRSALGLRSAAFDVAYSSGEGFVFTVYGYGHGVGLSQVGAGHLAEEGWDYREILSHYYLETEVLEINRTVEER